MAESDDLPIRPGSQLDLAIDSTADHIVGETNLEEFELRTLVDVDDAHHMLALGTRLKLRLLGVTDPRQATAKIYRQWYGQAP